MAQLEHTVEVTTERPVMPNMCVCCGRPPTESYRPEPPGRMRGMPEMDEPLSFPYCEACKKHLRAAQDRRSSNLVALNLAIWGVGIPLATRLPIFALIPGPAIAAALYFRNLRTDLRASQDCAAEGAAARVTWVRKDVYAFSFARKDTAESFAELNRETLFKR